MLALTRCPRGTGRNAGFTLVELAVALTILALLLALAAPAFTAFVRNAQLASVAHALVASLNAARSEAMKRNLPALVVPLEPGRRDWNQGFVAFVDIDRDGRYTESTDLTVLKHPLDAPFLDIVGTGSAKGPSAYVRYDGSGFARKSDDSLNPLSILISRNDVSGNDVPAQSRRLFIARTGRLRICTPASANDRRCQSTADDG